MQTAAVRESRQLVGVCQLSQAGGSGDTLAKPTYQGAVMTQLRSILVRECPLRLRGDSDLTGALLVLDDCLDDRRFLSDFGSRPGVSCSALEIYCDAFSLDCCRHQGGDGVEHLCVMHVYHGEDICQLR